MAKGPMSEAQKKRISRAVRKAHRERKAAEKRNAGIGPAPTGRAGYRAGRAVPEPEVIARSGQTQPRTVRVAIELTKQQAHDLLAGVLAAVLAD